MKTRIRVNATPDNHSDEPAMQFVGTLKGEGPAHDRVALNIAVEGGLINACRVVMSPGEARKLALDLLNEAQKIEPINY